MQVFEFLIEDAYNTLVVKKLPWPKQLSKEDKLQLIEQIHNYWQDKENYLKCQMWHEFKEQIES